MAAADAFFNTVRDAIAPSFRKTAHAGELEHIEHHHDGSRSTFRLRASAKHVAFSLDHPGQDPFPVLAAGLNSRNDLTVICLSPAGVPLVFVIECKNSPSPGDAQHQIECGIAFCKYMFDLALRDLDVDAGDVRYFGVVAYRPKFPPKGVTRPLFVRQGKGNILRTDWYVDVVLPLAELIRSTEL